VGTDKIGVFYPLQTFSKRQKIAFEDIPILIEAENKKASRMLQKLANSISRHVHSVNSKDRMAIHVAAVFACNFTNYLLGAAEGLLKKQDFDLDLLRPLIAETLNKSLDMGPKNAQTGPAARGDLKVLDKHMEFLQGTDIQDIYQLITEKILNR
jgi:predicted short-subunit dehydrogenase-like oxidoreductase (DUF2520 family)